jgi:hypothetical protein
VWFFATMLFGEFKEASAGDEVVCNAVEDEDTEEQSDG